MALPGVSGIVGGASSQPRISISDETISDTTISPQNASAAYQLTSAGVINEITVSGGTTSLGDWIDPTSAAGANYEALVTVTSGSLTSGTVGSRVALSTTRTWELEQGTPGQVECVFALEIFRTGGATALDSATITLVADEA